MPRTALPIDEVLPQIVASLRQRPSLVLQAPTGAGKTTRVPPALLDGGIGGSRRILLLEPRRLAARAAARRMAEERGCRLGDDIGYHVRFDRCCTRQTRILAVTPGIVLRLLHENPFLDDVGAILFDEFHERQLDSDLALGMVRLLQQTVRPDLRVAVMSATLATAPLAAYLGDCQVIVSTGRTFPVDIVHDAKPTQSPWPVAVARAVENVLDRTAGDVLAFLPGLHEIRQTMRQLDAVAAARDLALMPLHGDLPPQQQDAALLPQPRRKVVLATNVAETSVTVEGVTAVVDSGLARVQRFDPRVGLDRLVLTHISQASAEQRAGRAGRTQAGVCIRLWSEAAHRQRPVDSVPEIRRVDLAGAVLHLLCLGEKDVTRFPWLEPPPASAVEQALTLLRRLGAVAENSVTATGQEMARLPVHPRLARLLLEGRDIGALPRAALAAALLAERDPFAQTIASSPAAPVDLLDRLDALEAFERREKTASNLNQTAARWLLRARDQMLREARGKPQAQVASREFGAALVTAFPDRVCRRRANDRQRGLMVGGRGVRLRQAAGDSELFLALDVDGGGAEAQVRLTAQVRREWLPTDRVTTAIEVAFDEDTKRVSARKRVRYEDLLLEESPAALPPGDEVARVLAAAAALHLADVLPANDTPGGNYLLRLRCLQQWLPDMGLPSTDEQALKELLPWLCAGCRSFDELRRADWLGALQGRLTHAQRQLVEREAPERLQVPKGSRIALRYEVGRPPILAVRIQEVFGWTETPRIACGRVRVLLHLLAPNYRPQQVTDDLASFWKNTYAQVRKELRARYPKHAWPETPA